MGAPIVDGEARPVPSAVLSVKIDILAEEVRELRRDLGGLVRIDLYEEGRRADRGAVTLNSHRIEMLETALREQNAANNARRELDERDRQARRWQLGLAVFAAVCSVILAFTDRF